MVLCFRGPITLLTSLRLFTLIQKIWIIFWKWQPLWVSLHFKASCDYLFLFLIFPCRKVTLLSPSPRYWRQKKHLTDGAGTFSSVTPIDHTIFSSAVCEWCSAAAADLVLAETRRWDFGEKRDSLKVFHWQQRVGVRQQVPEPRLTPLQGRAGARGQRSRGKEVRQTEPSLRERDRAELLTVINRCDHCCIWIYMIFWH